MTAVDPRLAMTQPRSSAPTPGMASESLVDRYQQALEAQQLMMRGLMGR